MKASYAIAKHYRDAVIERGSPFPVSNFNKFTSRIEENYALVPVRLLNALLVQMREEEVVLREFAGDTLGE